LVLVLKVFRLSFDVACRVRFLDTISSGSHTISPRCLSLTTSVYPKTALVLVVSDKHITIAIIECIAFAAVSKLNIRFRKSKNLPNVVGAGLGLGPKQRRWCRSTGAEGVVPFGGKLPGIPPWGAMLGGRTRRRVVVRRSLLATSEPDARPRRRGYWSAGEVRVALELGFSGMRTANWRRMAHSTAAAAGGNGKMQYVAAATR
jgi:hypothetical protein